MYNLYLIRILCHQSTFNVKGTVPMNCKSVDAMDINWCLLHDVIVWICMYNI